MSSAAPTPLAGVTILFVDDSADERRLFELRFGLLGAMVTAVESAERAVDMLSALEIDVLVSDIVLPSMSGYELVRTLRGMSADRGGLVPAIAVTGRAGREDRLEALDAGFSDHIVKPYDCVTLVQAIGELRGEIGRLRAQRATARAAEAEVALLRERGLELVGPCDRVFPDEGMGMLGARRAEALAAIGAFIRERFGLRTLDEVRFGMPLVAQDGAGVWKVTLHSAGRVLEVGIQLLPDGRIDIREYGLR